MAEGMQGVNGMDITASVFINDNVPNMPKLYLLNHSFFSINAWIKSMGRGKTTVVAFSLEMSFKVCK